MTYMCILLNALWHNVTSRVLMPNQDPVLSLSGSHSALLYMRSAYCTYKVNSSQRLVSANPYAEKGVLNEIIQDKIELDNAIVQDHVPGHVFEVVRILFAL